MGSLRWFVRLRRVRLRRVCRLEGTNVNSDRRNGRRGPSLAQGGAREVGGRGLWWVRLARRGLGEGANAWQRVHVLVLHSLLVLLVHPSTARPPFCFLVPAPKRCTTMPTQDVNSQMPGMKKKSMGSMKMKKKM